MLGLALDLTTLFEVTSPLNIPRRLLFASPEGGTCAPCINQKQRAQTTKQHRTPCNMGWAGCPWSSSGNTCIPKEFTAPCTPTNLPSSRSRCSSRPCTKQPDNKRSIQLDSQRPVSAALPTQLRARSAPSLSPCLSSLNPGL